MTSSKAPQAGQRLPSEMKHFLRFLFFLDPCFSEPCKPTGLAASGSCYNETVELDWWDAEGASEYEVSITGDLGYIAAFRTAETMKEMELPCGQQYTFTVKARDDRCESPESLPEEYKTGMHVFFLDFSNSVYNKLVFLDAVTHFLLRALHTSACREFHTL